MEAAIYIDVLFFVTWSMNTFLLWAAGRVAGFQTKKWRLWLGGLFSAAAYCIWFCLFQENGGILLSLLLLLMGIAAAYLPKRGRNFLRLLGAGILCSFLLGGGMLAFFGMTQMQRFLSPRHTRRSQKHVTDIPIHFR